MTRLLRYLVLPKQVTPFEAQYLRRLNKVGLGFFWMHPPVFVLVAYLAGTSIVTAMLLSLAAMIGPVVAYYGFRDRPRVVGVIYGITAMLMGGSLVYIGQGPMQIEMHFYFFVLIALLSVFGNPMAVIAAAVTVAVHHFVVWLVLPRGVFNYDASFWTVAVHAVFVVIESIAAVFVARSFFDNVIGLEQIVETRTRALDARNHDMTRILDNVGQGFITVALDGTLGREWSRALATWFGEPAPGAKAWDFLLDDPSLRAWMEVSFESLSNGFMPTELVLEQLPHRMARGDRELLVEYHAIGEPVASVLVVVTDITADLARQRAEAANRELTVVVEKATRDRAAFAAFHAETSRLVEVCIQTPCPPGDAAALASLKRELHTLKGNAALFGVASVADACHALETEMAESETPPTAEARARVAAAWQAFRDRSDRVLGLTEKRTLVVDWDEYQTVVAAITAPEPAWAERVRAWGNAPTRPRLEQCADYARLLGHRLDKTNFTVAVADHELHLPLDRYASLWSAFVHAVRNTVDHGVEPAEARVAVGKSPEATIELATVVIGDELHLSISDDGAGIDWERIAAKARARGLATATPRDLEEALFASGVSTSEHVSEVSGRGVGMDALRAACRELGGRVAVTSVRGRGTTVTCTVPLVAKARRASTARIPRPAQLV